MALIRTITEGTTKRVVTRDGKPSCTCCDTCIGLWGPGYDTHPNNITLYSFGSVTSDSLFRYDKCGWLDASLARQQVQFWVPGGWQAYSHTIGAETLGYKSGGINAGPLGNYYSNTDGTGSLLYTVT
jgi:hypothetical protein